MTRHYVLIETYTGFVWGEADAPDPVAAVRAIQGDGDYWHRSPTAHVAGDAFHVHLAPAEWAEVQDGQNRAEIARVERLPLVAIVQERGPREESN